MIKPGTRGFVPQGNKLVPAIFERLNPACEYIAFVKVLAQFRCDSGVVLESGDGLALALGNFTPAKHDIPGEDDAA